MPSPIGHVIAGVAAGWLVAGAPRSVRGTAKVAGTFPAQAPATLWREAALFGALAALPDIDLLFGAHSGPTHSLGAAAIVGLTALVVAWRLGARRPWRLALACAAAYASHVLLDWLGSDASPPLGVMALWPFSHAYVESNLHLFMAISRRYYQGWVFAEQNVRAIAWELVILLPILAVITWLRTRAWKRVVGVTLVLLSAGPVVEVPRAAQWPERLQDSGYRDMLDEYRRGNVERAGARLKVLLGAAEGDVRFERWLSGSRREDRTSDIEALFLLVTDSIIAVWREDDPYPERLLEVYRKPFTDLRLALRRINRRSDFLRAWYLLWESFRQFHADRPLPNELDYLAESLATFPNDAVILLAAGSRYELNWTRSIDNRHRALTPEPPTVTQLLLRAREVLRKSVNADPNESEARLRLAHVLLELEDLDDVPNILLNYDWSRDGAAFEYLMRLLEGDLHERRGDLRAADMAYERAVQLAPVPQSALVAQAHLAHLEGRRAEAARLVAQALSGNHKGVDPWWLFIRGQAWRFELNLKAVRAMVMK